MPGIVTRRFRIHNSEQFHEAFSEASPTQMYLFIGRVDAFPDDNNPPTPPDSIQETEFNQWRNMLAAKRVQSSDISFSLSRYDWSTGKVYRQFDPTSNTLFDTPASSNTMYVITEDFNVYKCLFNNKGGASTVKPTGTSTSVLSTADGYKWKFMYSISAADALKFVTSNFIPVQTLTANDGSAQFSVQSAAANGNIEIINVTGGGSNYKSHSGTVAAPASQAITLGSSANTSDDVYCLGRGVAAIRPKKNNGKNNVSIDYIKQSLKLYNTYLKYKGLGAIIKGIKKEDLKNIKLFKFDLKYENFLNEIFNSIELLSYNFNKVNKDYISSFQDSIFIKYWNNIDDLFKEDD